MKHKKHATSKHRERAAHHEAGHAVVAYGLKRRFAYITIKRAEESAGHVHYSKAPGMDKWPDEAEKYRLEIEREIMVSLAGPHAEYIYAGRWNHNGAASDRSIAIDVASWLTSDSRETELMIQWLGYRTKKMLENPYRWKAVQALARELLNKETIAGKEARSIIRGAIRDYFDSANVP